MENIIIGNKTKLEDLKELISKDGVEKLHVLTDFDRTLTSLFVNGKKVTSLISILRDGNYLTPDYPEKANRLYNKYYPIEIDPSIPMEKKKKAMNKWWTAHFDLLIESGLNKKDIESISKSKEVKFRKGFSDFIDILKENDIPLVIMSACGLGANAISMFLEEEGKLYDKIHIISNLCEWDKNGNIASFKKPIIHVMNKDETAIKNFPAFETIKERKNVLLLGDSLGDIGMAKGFNYNNLIKIGFLNDNIEKNLENYKINYDALILNDSSMDYVNQLLKEIVN